MLIEIKSWITGSVLFSGEYKNISDALKVGINSGADLSGADLLRADLSGANLSRANLSWADLSRANLSRANLSGADLSWANLSLANLSGTDLSGADLSCADLLRANLSGANLSGADLSCADLSRANLSGANLSGANLSRADLDLKHCFLSISPIGSENGCLWVMKNDKGILKYNRGCFSGTEQEFIDAVKQKHGGTKTEKIYLSAVAFIKLKTGK